ncbi:MAG: family N-acetyltransferase [Holophagaceae bacterium]|nr:family N-acetyltransferase [Holophagaceae bacterium]
MQPHLILRIHTDTRLGLGHVARALVIQAQWRALGGLATLAVSGDERARRLGQGRHPFLDQALDCPVVDLGEDLHGALPQELKVQAHLVLVDQWDTTPEQIQALRPLKVAIMEDDGDAHESADLLFQPFLEGSSWPSAPLKSVGGRKTRPCETQHGGCRVLRGSEYVVVSPEALGRRPKREVLQPLSVRKLLVTFGGSDGADLAGRAFQILQRLVTEQRWMGSCTILAPRGIQEPPFRGCTVMSGLPGLTHRLQEFDAIWAAAGVTLNEALCMGVPVAAWGQNDRQHQILSDLAMNNGCLDLGVGPQENLEATFHSLDQWLGPEGQDSRQEQSRDGMGLIDGLGAARVVQELWNLTKPTLDDVKYPR